VVGRRAPEKGMTLVELMITMIIASIVAASTFMFFAGQQRVYETQTKMLNVQQNVWAAMEGAQPLCPLRGAGMFGCVRPVGGIVASPPPNRSLGVTRTTATIRRWCLAYAISLSVPMPACARTTRPPARCNEFPRCGSLTKWIPINPRPLESWVGPT